MLIIYSLTLYATSNLLPGLSISGGIISYIVASLVLSLCEFFLRPILTIITLPLTLITLGLFSWIINAIILFVVTIFYRNILVSSFLFPGVSYSGFTIPQFHVNLVLSYLIISVTIYFIKSFAYWLVNES